MDAKRRKYDVAAEAVCVARNEWNALDGQQTAKRLPATSPKAQAPEPSEEFRFTWIELGTSEYGMFYRTAQDALEEATNNYLGFPPSMKDRQVFIMECVGVASAPSVLRTAGLRGDEE